MVRRKRSDKEKAEEHEKFLKVHKAIENSGGEISARMMFPCENERFRYRAWKKKHFPKKESGPVEEKEEPEKTLAKEKFVAPTSPEIELPDEITPELLDGKLREFLYLNMHNPKIMKIAFDYIKLTMAKFQGQTGFEPHQYVDSFNKMMEEAEKEGNLHIMEEYREAEG